MEILGFYISRTDWKTKFCQRDAWALYLQQRIANLEVQLEKAQRNDMPRDAKGRFISKQDLMTEQLKAERDANKPHWDDIKGAGK